MGFDRVRWLIDMEPREVQIEAIARSYYGYKLRDRAGEEMNPRPLPHANRMPRAGWGHLMEMRLGKTATTLNEFELFSQEYDFENLVVFCPNSFKEGWVDEAKSVGFSLPFVAYESSNHQQAEMHLRSAKRRLAISVNYEALKYEKTSQFLEDMIGPRTLLVADESIKLKNFQSLQTKAAIKLSKLAGVTRVLTGLPMTQGPHDLYPQLRFIKQQSGVNPFAFRNRFCKMGGFKGKAVVGAQNEDELARLIEDNAFKAKKLDWAKYVDPDRFLVSLKMTKEQADHYKAIDKEFITTLDDGEEISVDQVVSKLMKMQQISSGFIYNESGNLRFFMDPEKTPKLAYLKEALDEGLSSKVVVCYHYSASGDILLGSLAQYKPAIIRSDMWMKKNERNVESEKARFNKSSECRVMILQMSAGKYGHDLSGIAGDRCTHMAFYENTYSLDDRMQIEARITTAFQDWPSTYWDFVSSPVEMNAIKALNRKENVVEAVLGAYRLNTERKTIC